MYSITIFRFFHLVSRVKDRLSDCKLKLHALKPTACECLSAHKSPSLLLMCVLQIGLVLLHAPDWASLTDSGRDGDIMET